MKRMKKVFLTLGVTLMILTSINAQEKDKNKVVRKNIPVKEFTGIDIGGSFNIYYTVGSPVSLEIETNNKFFDKINTKVSGKTLSVKSRNIRRPDKLNVFITAPYLEKIKISGAADFHSKGLVKTSGLQLQTSGASDTEIEVEVSELKTEASGASSLKISGKADKHILVSSGASDVNARSLGTQETIAETSGASHVKVVASEVLELNSSGASSISTRGSSAEVIKTSNIKSIGHIYTDDYEDSTNVNVAGLKIKKVEEADSTKVYIGNHTLIIDDNGNVKHRRWRKKKFNGHWAGVEIGVNAYLNSDFNMNFPKDYEYMNLRMEKSINVNLNIWDQNFALTKNKKFGVLTGIGYSINNYRFNNNITLIPDSSNIVGFKDVGVNVRKSKLVINYITVPLIFEWQSNKYCKVNSWHVGLGAILGIRVTSHTKKYFDELNKEYKYAQYNPKTDKYENVFNVESPGHNISKNHNDFHLNPFKLSGTLRVGWSIVNLYANYSFTTLFRDGKGPDLYPFEVGLSLVGW